ncbi:hypothetical protein [Arsenophonus endosymbiont of Aphis craccivora]|uniref:hypothetical protein n=1 Tax=Arsenophonus endosymbiont of Aphis craccivora TaxID=1231049 RepID=UPI0015E02A67|nr:hypothetical protein [Arsenophonus endosymbiont of Aphis craccivora]
MPWGPDVETNLAIRSANHLKVRFIQQSQSVLNELLQPGFFIIIIFFDHIITK